MNLNDQKAQILQGYPNSTRETALQQILDARGLKIDSNLSGKKSNLHHTFQDSEYLEIDNQVKIIWPLMHDAS